MVGDKCLSCGLFGQHALCLCRIQHGHLTLFSIWKQERSTGNGHSLPNISEIPPPPQSCQRRGRLCERIARFSTSLASYASLLFWRPPVSGLIEMFSQSQASELSIETVLEIIVSMLGRPLAPCQTNKQKEGEVGNKSRRLSSVNTGCLERKA